MPLLTGFTNQTNNLPLLALFCHVQKSLTDEELTVNYTKDGLSRRSSVVEHLHGKEGVTSSILVVGSTHQLISTPLEIWLNQVSQI